VLFLDEPTTGLDPRSRIEMWQSVQQLANGGTTVLLTTQYLDEADQLADRVVVIDAGRVIAEGTPNQLKSRVGGDQLEVAVADERTLRDVAVHLARVAAATPDLDHQHLTASVVLTGGFDGLAAAVRELDRAGLAIKDLTVRRPTLDDVFLRLTGRHREDEPVSAEVA
jgi:ABC-2 type transport system ATP-binding protein